MVTVLANRYELRERIGRGAMAEVWAAFDRATGREVAVKLAHPWLRRERELVTRFEREASVLGLVSSPYICSLIEAGRTVDDVPFIVLERLVGETLAELLARQSFLPFEAGIRIAGDVLEALVVAHRVGVVHRDLSPDNVFLQRRRDGWVETKVLDFGLAKADEAGLEGSTGKGATMGSLPYAAPEQLGDGAQAGPRADLYAVGTILFQMLSGRMPFGDARGTALVVLKREHDPPSIDEVTGIAWPATLSAFLAKTMAVAPRRRYASAKVALAVLRTVHGTGPRITIPEPGVGATSTLPLHARMRR